MRGRPPVATEKLKLFPAIAAAIGGATDVPTWMIAGTIGDDAPAELIGNEKTLRSRVSQTLRKMRCRGLATGRNVRSSGEKGPWRHTLWSLTPAGIALAESIPTAVPRSC